MAESARRGPLLILLWPRQSLRRGGGVMLLLGLFTPFAGIMAAAVEVWIAFSHPGYRWPQIGLDGLGLSLAMIGPGAWSIDARLFGRKQIDLSNFERESDPARKW